MTLIVTVNSPESIWILADRRLSSPGRVPKDDACKVMVLETGDGVALLGYAGLGATGLGTEPSDWMSAVLRGRKFPLEHSLKILAEALNREFPPHMIRFPGEGGPAHHIIISAFLENQVRLYTIDLIFAPDRRSYYFRYTRHVGETPTLPTSKTPRCMISGTGALYLDRDRRWFRSLLRLVKAHDGGRVSTFAVADYLAALNYEVHIGLKDETVGPRCIVVRRHKKGGVHKSGGGNQFYTGTIRDSNSPCLPTIAGGFDVKTLCDLMLPRMNKMFPRMYHHDVQKDSDDEPYPNLGQIFDEPDETLR